MRFLVSRDTSARDVTRILISSLVHEPFKLLITHDLSRLCVIRVEFDEQSAAVSPPLGESEYVTSSVTIDGNHKMHVTNDRSRHNMHIVSFTRSDKGPIALRIGEATNGIIFIYDQDEEEWRS